LGARRVTLDSTLMKNLREAPSAPRTGNLLDVGIPLVRLRVTKSEGYKKMSIVVLPAENLDSRLFCTALLAD